MSDTKDLWALVHEWRYTGKASNATDEDLWSDAMADQLEKAIEASNIVPLSRLRAVEAELERAEVEMAKRDRRAVEVVGALLSAAGDCNEWLCRTDREHTAHQRNLAAAITKATAP